MARHALHKFPEPKIKKIHSLLNPKGFILLTTCCEGGSSPFEMLNLWFVTTNGYDRLPSITEFKKQLSDSGFTNVKSKRLIPGDEYHAFVGFK